MSNYTTQEREVKEGFPPYRPKHTEGEFLFAKQWLVDNRKNMSSTANFAKIHKTKNGIGAFDHLGNPCHANSVYDSDVMKNTVLFVTENGHSRRHSLFPPTDNLTYEKALPFLKWLVQDSCFSPYFVNRDDLSFCWEHGFVVVPTIPTILMQTMLIMTRHFYECRDAAFVKFGEILEQTGSGLFAYLCTMSTTYSRSSSGDNHPLGFSYQHRAVGPVSISDLPLIMSETPGDGFKTTTGRTPSLLYEKTFYSSGFTNYYGGNLIFTNRPNKGQTPKSPLDVELMADKEYLERLSAYRKSVTQQEAYTPPNPFDRSNSRPRLSADQMTYTEFYEVGVPYLIQTMKGS